MIKCGIRRNLLYPSLFVLFTSIRRVIKIILESPKLVDFESPFLLAIIMFFSEFLLGGIFTYIKNRTIIKNKNIKTPRVKLIQNDEQLKPRDGSLKIFLLIFFSAIIEFIGAITRRFLINLIGDYESEQLNIRLRSIEIVISSVLSYSLLGTKINRHHFVSLIIISICLISAVIFEFIYIRDYQFILNGLFVLLISTLTRSFLDIIEKYLFDVDFVNNFKLTTFEGFIDTLLSLVTYFFKEPREEIHKLFKFKRIKFFIAIILLILYGFLSFLKNIYRRFTLMEFSPMTRALAESILDPFLIIYDYFNYIFKIDGKNEENKNNYKYRKFGHLIIILTLSIIMVFCSLVYNEFLVLYLCSMEKETYIEISKRARESKFNTNFILDNISISEGEETSTVF